MVVYVSVLCMKRIEATIFGRVQVVLFRDFTKRQAEKLGVVGFVENKSDGTVHVVAEGEEEKLQALIEKLRRGPVAARVDDVDVEWGEARGEFEGFEVKYYA